MQAQRSTKLFWILATLIVLLASVVRVTNLTQDSLWLDEINTLLVVRDGTVLNPFSAYARDHPPLLYWLIGLSVALFGESEFALRLVPLFGGIASVALIIAFGRMVESPYVGLWSGLLLALLPFHLGVSQEARHYSLLLFFSLATYLYLLKAVADPRPRWWVAFAVATALNLYTHFAAFIVLAAESVALLIWIGVAAQRRDRRRLLWPLGAAAIVLLLYAPWIMRAYDAFAANTSADTQGVTAAADLITWVANAFIAFGFNDFIAAVVIFAFAIFGMERWIERRRVYPALLVASIAIMPLVLIVLLGIARWAFPKYLIYMLPLYLTLAAVGLEEVRLSYARLAAAPRWVGIAFALGGVALLVLAAAPGLAAEYDRMERDWRGAVQDVAARAAEGDVMVSLALDLPDGFNQGGLVLPYYLDRAFDEYTLLASRNLVVEDVAGLAQRTDDVWGFVLNRIVPPASDQLDSAEYQGDLYTLSLLSPPATTLEKLILLFDSVLATTVAPAPQCLIRQDLALLHLANQDPATAATLLDEAVAQCPADTPRRNALAGDVFAAQLLDAQDRGDVEMTRQAAARLLELDAKNSAALEVLSVVDLLAAFEAGEVQVSAEAAPEAAPEPVEIRRFTMPDTGDFDDVIFAHPPAALQFAVTLPDEPAALQTRLALDPASWEWGGDGVTFVVSVTTEDGTTELLRRHITPDGADRRWHAVTVPLDAFAGQAVTLTLATEPGPAGDDSADWAGWGAPRVVVFP